MPLDAAATLLHFSEHGEAAPPLLVPSPPLCMQTHRASTFLLAPTSSPPPMTMGCGVGCGLVPTLRARLLYPPRPCRGLQVGASRGGMIPAGRIQSKVRGNTLAEDQHPLA
ncbi:uncharacterized protein PAN0_005c2558 [Moesziomyces antarcticus]|uniref:Uncharacterized protein n=1 Tax=Pseudozyma antarctica TaxID=84753 RepID=A0A081CCE9_PSEA2|nr:uncharacterized protein PAN0_005c2558 [Moesziomyces antarcticus]GAK64345.1 hypothetical protein PAN0_005c2558 [Moesziomyces antarcticus]